MVLCCGKTHLTYREWKSALKSWLQSLTKYHRGCNSWHLSKLNYKSSSLNLSTNSSLTQPNATVHNHSLGLSEVPWNCPQTQPRQALFCLSLLFLTLRPSRYSSVQLARQLSSRPHFSLIYTTQLRKTEFSLVGRNETEWGWEYLHVVPGGLFFF